MRELTPDFRVDPQRLKIGAALAGVAWAVKKLVLLQFLTAQILFQETQRLRAAWRILPR